MFKRISIFIAIFLLIQFGSAFADLSDYADPYDFDSWIGTTKDKFISGNPMAKNSDF